MLLWLVFGDYCEENWLLLIWCCSWFSQVCVLSYLKWITTFWGNLFVLIMPCRRLDESSKGVQSTLWCLLRTFAITWRGYIIVLSVSYRMRILSRGCSLLIFHIFIYKFDVMWIVQDIRHKFGKFYFFNIWVILIFLHHWSLLGAYWVRDSRDG